MAILPLPVATAAHATADGKPTKTFYNWIKSVSDNLLAGTLPKLLIGAPTGGDKGAGTINAEKIFDDGDRVFAQGGDATGGLQFTTLDLGTITSGTVTPDPTGCLKQKLENNGAFTLSPSSKVGDVELQITNGASAGTITLSGFTKQFTGDALDSTSGHVFIAFIYVFDAGSAILFKAMQ